MDILLVARETPTLPPTAGELTDPTAVKALIPRLPYGPIVGPLLARLALGGMVLGKDLDRGASRAAIGVAIQRSKPRGVVVLGADLSRELLGEGLPAVGGLRELHSKPLAGIARAKQEDIERLLSELSQRAHVPWSPPSMRAAPARVLVRTEEAEAQAAALIEKGQWQQTAALLRSAEPLGPRGTNMLGRALLQMGDRDGARAAFERTLQLDTGNTIARRQLDTLS